MPNWVHNHLKISDEYRSKILNENDKVDFNIVVPMPESLNCESGSTNEAAIYAYLSLNNSLGFEYVEKSELAQKILYNKVFGTSSIKGAYNSYKAMIEGDPERNEKLYEEGKNLVENFRNYGATTWYDWSLDHWGCKWNAKETRVLPTDNENEIMLEFDTPWGIPGKWLQALNKEGIPFYLEWLEEQGYHGEVISDGNQIIERDLEDIDNDEEYNRFWGETDDE